MLVSASAAAAGGAAALPDSSSNEERDCVDASSLSFVRRESSGGMEWLGVWNCIFSGSEFSNFGA